MYVQYVRIRFMDMYHRASKFSFTHERPRLNALLIQYLLLTGTIVRSKIHHQSPQVNSNQIAPIIPSHLMLYQANEDQTPRNQIRHNMSVSLCDCDTASISRSSCSSPFPPPRGIGCCCSCVCCACCCCSKCDCDGS